ncbi:MAG: NADH-quinone oxidoreductase subunit NuoH [Verrucomicrobiae bacterium]|nr:NADH-quinone oxidoreductase subunit NuoH [Verrucomicrobiae bacterium]
MVNHAADIVVHWVQAGMATPWLVWLVITLMKCGAVVGVMMGMVAYTVLAERRFCAFIQDRLGPNRVGPFGLLQPVADGMKLFLKENVLPGHVNKVYYVLAPAITLFPALATIAVIPFGNRLGGEKMVIADLNVGILWVFSLAALGVYGIVLAGWASNSKYPFIGGVRSAAQLISYELAMGLSVIGVFMLAGSLNLGQVVEYQSHCWLVLKQPLGFLIFMVAMFAETNRTPFDLPEGEQELAAGYNTEYGSMKFALFFMGEYANMVVASAVMVTLFFGGWQVPFIPVEQWLGCSWLSGMVYIGCFLAKLAAFLFLFIWVRWTLPRFRYDQLMNLGWKVLLPLGLLNILLTALVLAGQR